MGLFSKNPCTFCGKQVGFIKGKKIKGGEHICDDCEKKCSSFIDVSKFDKDFLSDNMEYMKKEDILYKKEFEPLDNSEKKKFKYIENGIIFADSIGMFEVVSHKSKKKEYKELFRYDQILDFDYYAIENVGASEKPYQESGLMIKLNCPIDENGFSNIDMRKGKAHPFVSVLKIPFAKDTDDYYSASLAKAHLNELFGRPSESLFGSMKQGVIGTGVERAQIKAGVNSVKALAGLAKAAVTKDEDAKTAAVENLTGSAKEAIEATFNYGARYTDRADSAEKRAWEE